MARKKRSSKSGRNSTEPLRAVCLHIEVRLTEIDKQFAVVCADCGHRLI